MLSKDHQRASDLIWNLWRQGEITDDLPTGLKPRTRAEGYAIQAGLDARSSRPRAGWKIAATSIAGQRHIGVDGPLAGRILEEFLRPPGATVSLATNRMRVAEPEFAFRLGQALPPRERDYSVDEVMAAVATLHPAIELPDSRFADFAKVGGPTLIAEAACARELILGPAVTSDWRRLDLAKHAVDADIVAAGGASEREGIGSNVLGDPRIALTWIANELRQHGIGLAAGEFVTTGTCMIPIALVPGLHIRADFGELGTLEVRTA